MGEPTALPDSTAASQFPNTRWSVVLQAQIGDSLHANEALEEICKRYWYPIYAFLRKKGWAAADAEDLTQGFFQRLLSDGTLDRARKDRGKLRSFLLADLKRYLIDDSRRENALKRGGDQTFIPFDQASAEARYANSFTEAGADPEAMFEKAWAADLMGGVMSTLATRYAQAGKKHLFEALRDSITGGHSEITYAEIATKLDTSEGALRLQVMRMRRAFREQVEREIAETVESPDQVADELRNLVRLIRQ